jgi:hypothetical protein
VKHRTRLTISLVCLAFLVLFGLILPSNAYAYLDPGTGSYILQLIIAALMGALFAVKQYWQKIKTFFKSMLSPKHKKEKR